MLTKRNLSDITFPCGNAGSTVIQSSGLHAIMTFAGTMLQAPFSRAEMSYDAATGTVKPVE
jgi:hypothetical protein